MSNFEAAATDSVIDLVFGFSDFFQTIFARIFALRTTASFFVILISFTDFLSRFLCFGGFFDFGFHRYQLIGIVVFIGQSVK